MKKKLATMIFAMAMTLTITTTAFAGAWQNDGYGWWYQNDDGSYPAYQWENIDGIWYHFNSFGYMDTGWLYDGAWYFLNEDGTMFTGWLYDGDWYYLNPDGTMATGWIQDGGKWYFMGGYGAMQTGWIYDGALYYLDPSGVMATGWLWDGAWYYMGSSGAMQTGWVQDKGAWYYLDESGIMQTGWLQQGETWYYLMPSGVMATGTQVIDGVTYYFDNNGVWLPEGASDETDLSPFIFEIMGKNESEAEAWFEKYFGKDTGIDKEYIEGKLFVMALDNASTMSVEVGDIIYDWDAWTEIHFSVNGLVYELGLGDNINSQEDFDRYYSYFESIYGTPEIPEEHNWTDPTGGTHVCYKWRNCLSGSYDLTLTEAHWGDYNGMTIGLKNTTIPAGWVITDLG